MTERETDRKGQEGGGEGSQNERPSGGKVAFDRCIFFENSFQLLSIGPRVNTCIA